MRWAFYREKWEFFGARQFSAAPVGTRLSLSFAVGRENSESLKGSYFSQEIGELVSFR
jgi:hypothetical protein